MKLEKTPICKREKQAFILAKGRLYLESKFTKEEKAEIKQQGYTWRKPIISRADIKQLKEWLIDARPAYDDGGLQARDFLEFCEYLRLKLGLQKEPILTKNDGFVYWPYPEHKYKGN
jgi:hypothetical protein